MLELLYAYVLGLLSILSPCSFIVVPVITSEINARLQRILKFLIGLTITFSILGILSAITGKLLTNFLGPWLYLISAIITLIAGLDMLNLIKLKIPSLFTARKGTNTFVLGLIYGGVALSCIGPLLSVILAYIVAKASIFYGFIMMLTYSLGFITPFVLFGILVTDKDIIKRIAKHSSAIRKIGGVLLILVSGYLFYFASRGLI